MITRRVRVQLVVFLVISALGIVYTGFTYVGIRPFAQPYTVGVDFADSGGIFAGAEVLERGVPVGRVTDLDLTPGGVRVELEIDERWKIPADSDAVVANLSAVGEQYVDLRPRAAGPPYLADGDVIPRSRTSIPVETSELLLNLDRFVRSVDPQELKTVLRELGAAFDGAGPDLRRIIEEGDRLTLAATQALPETKRLIRDGKTVLDTQRAVSAELRTFAANLAEFSRQLVASDPDLRQVLDNGVRSAAQLQGLLADNERTLPVLLGNLTTLGRIQAARIPGLRQLLVAYPANVANAFYTTAGGRAHFGLVTNEDGPVCTQGYEGTQRRSNSPPDWGGAANLDTYCTEPATGPSSVRGAQNAPRPPGDTTAGPPPGGYPQLPGEFASAVVAPYDPATGLLQTPDGRQFRLGDPTGVGRYLATASWEWLLLGPALG